MSPEILHTSRALDAWWRQQTVPALRGRGEILAETLRRLAHDPDNPDIRRSVKRRLGELEEKLCEDRP